jgi:RNA polymerase sporulation-specific sigma factor
LSAFDFTALSDEELIARRGELGTITAEVISSRYLRTCSYLCRRLLGSVSDERFDDLLGESLIALFSAVETFDSVRGVKFSTYASACIKNRLFSCLKSLPVSDSTDVSAADETGSVPHAPSPEHIFIEKESAEALYRSLSDLLSDREFSVLSLRIDGYSYADIASKLGLSPKSVDNTMSRVRAKLRKKSPD